MCVCVMMIIITIVIMMITKTVMISIKAPIDPLHNLFSVATSILYPTQTLILVQSFGGYTLRCSKSVF